MGLIRSVDEISKELQKQKKLEQLERIEERKEKKRQQEQKENLKRYKNELELHLKTEFDQYFKKFGSEYIFEFYNRDRKKEILEQYFDTIKQIDKNGFETIPSKKELEQHFYKKYNTILKKAQQEQKQQELYNLKTSPEAETKNRFAFNWGGIIATLFFIPVVLLALPILFILFIIIRVCKDNEIKKLKSFFFYYVFIVLCKLNIQNKTFLFFINIFISLQNKSALKLILVCFSVC